MTNMAPRSARITSITRTAIAFGVICAYSGIAAGDSAKPSGAEIMKKVAERKVPDSSQAHVEMTIKKGDDHATKVFRSYALKVSDQESYSLLEFEKPVTTKILIATHGKDAEEDRWVKTSGGQPRRVAVGSGDQTFMQSHFSYEDLEIGKAKDAVHELSCEAGDKCTVDFAGAPHYRVKSVAKSASSYAYQIDFVRVSDFFLDKVEYYGKGDKKVKELVINETKSIDGYLVPMLITMNMADGGDSTVIKTLEVTLNPKGLTKQKFDKNLL